MPKKLTIVFVREQFEKEGYTLLTTDYTGCDQHLEYICPEEHNWHISWTHWQQGRRCAKCSGKKRHTIKFIQDQLKKEGYTLLTKEYKNAFQRLEYICPKGDYGAITWTSWQQGHRCFRCRYENNKRENNPRWNPDLTDEERIIERDYSEYIKWCCAVKERDGFTCQVCGQVGCRLVSHHLYSYNNSLDLRTDLTNGVCLCEKCHKAFHHKYGYGNNTKEQFEEFKCVLWHTFCIYISVFGGRYDYA